MLGEIREFRNRVGQRRSGQCGFQEPLREEIREATVRCGGMGVVFHCQRKVSGGFAAGEIKRFVDRFGWPGLVDKEGKAYIDAGLKYLKLTEPELMGRIERDPGLLRLPLVRGGKLVSVGHDEASWKEMLAAAAG